MLNSYLKQHLVKNSLIMRQLNRENFEVISNKSEQAHRNAVDDFCKNCHQNLQLSVYITKLF